MGFRTLEISQAAEIHIKASQLEISSCEGTALIPLEDLNQIMVHGANIRLSTMDLSILVQNKISVLTLDEKYLPTAIVLPFEGHSRQSKLMHAQISLTVFCFYLCMQWPTKLLPKKGTPFVASLSAGARISTVPSLFSACSPIHYCLLI